MLVDSTLYEADAMTIISQLKIEMAENDITGKLENMKTNGANIMCTCPWHDERRPSFGIHKETGVCHCFGCGAKASLPILVSKCLYDKEDRSLGNKWLRKHFKFTVVDSSYTKEIEREYKPINYVTEAELDSYRYYHPYMYQRHLTDDIIEVFDIGYDSKSNCITFPNRDIYGDCVFVARRSVKTKFFNYPSEVEKPVYGLYEYNNAISKQVVDGKLAYVHKYSFMHYNPLVLFICESMLDALRLWTWGYYAIALNGLGSESQIEILNKIPIREYVLCLDMDYRGLQARKRLMKLFKRKHVRNLQWDKCYKDIGEMPDEKYFEKILKK